MAYQTVNELFLSSVKTFGEREAVRFKQGDTWKSVTWTEFGAQARQLALALLSLGLQKGDRVCVVSNTRPEWEVADKAIALFGGVTVGVYQTLPANQVAYVLSHCEAKAVIIEDAAQFAKVVEMQKECPALEHWIVIDPTGCEGHDFHRWDALASADAARESEWGEKLDAASADLSSDDPATYIYTSGTTGPPKGAVLTHGNLVSEAEALRQAVGIRGDDLSLTWLPFAHIFQRAATWAGTLAGCPTAYAEGIDKLLDNLAEIQPTVFYSVPRIYEKAYSKILDRAQKSGFPKKQIFYWAMGVGREVSRRRQAGEPIAGLLGLQFKLANKLVFGKINALFGGKVRLIGSSGAPISQEILEFFHAADIVTLEAYGATETTGAVTVNEPDAYRFGTVGRPMRDVEIKIAADGEILVRGPEIFAGYYKDEAKTAEVLSADGWYATGDIGELDKDGFLRITDRKKDIIVTSGGKNVAPQNIEGALKESLFVSQAMVHGDKRKYLTCLLTLEPESLTPWAVKQGIPTDDWSALCADARVQRHIQAEVDRTNDSLARFETVKYFRIVPDDFTVETGELTPTLKVKRKVVTEKYRELLDSMYSD